MLEHLGIALFIKNVVYQWLTLFFIDFNYIILHVKMHLLIFSSQFEYLYSQSIKIKYSDFNAEIKYKSNNLREGYIQKRHQLKVNSIKKNKIHIGSK